MLVAIPLFGRRVSPRCVYAQEVALVEVQGEEVVSQGTTSLSIQDETELAGRLLELGVDRWICGGISHELAAELEAMGIEVVQNVAGEVDEILDALRRQDLHPGHGLHKPPPRPSSPPDGNGALPEVDCIACAGRPCTSGGSCPLENGTGPTPWLRGEEARIYDTSRDVSAESDPTLCRIAELVHFCIGTGYRRIGVAFCWELFQEVETLVRVLSRFFEVVTVCCRVWADPPPDGDSVATSDHACNPIAQARLLSNADTDLNVIAGLCLGCDVLFTRRSAAPVTTLFVKDRSLAHNPVGAIYTRYHLEELERSEAGRRAVRPGRN